MCRVIAMFSQPNRPAWAEGQAGISMLKNWVVRIRRRQRRYERPYAILQCLHQKQYRRIGTLEQLSGVCVPPRTD
jgi:hypothetical protein